MTKREAIEWLVEWRQARGGSVSPHNHRRGLERQTKVELLATVRRIKDGEAMIEARRRTSNQG